MKKNKTDKDNYKGIFHPNHFPATVGLFGFIISFGLFSLQLALTNSSIFFKKNRPLESFYQDRYVEEISYGKYADNNTYKVTKDIYSIEPQKKTITKQAVKDATIKELTKSANQNIPFLRTIFYKLNKVFTRKNKPLETYVQTNMTSISKFEFLNNYYDQYSKARDLNQDGVIDLLDYQFLLD